jgi:hypothetical protein
VTLLLASAACGDATSPNKSTATDALAATSSTDQLIARALAAALADETQRRNLHSALRDSRWMDHKLLLQEYLRTAAGAELTARAAAAVGLSESAFRAGLAELPAMDLYLPFREHRLAWRAPEGVYVVVTRDLDPARAVAYGSNGAAVELRQADGVPSRPLLVLHPAEPRIALAQAAVRRAGEAIELEGDAAHGTEAQLLELCAPESIYCEPAPEPPPYTPPPPPPPGDYITYLMVSEDDGWFGGNMEMEFRNYLGVFGTFGYCGYSVATRSGVHQDWVYDRDQINLFFVPAAQLGKCIGQRRIIEVWEMDNGSYDPHDYFGSRVNGAGFEEPRQIHYDPVIMGFFTGGWHRASVRITAK